MSKPGFGILPDDVYVVTPQGEKELKGGTTTLPGPVLQLMVGIDGKATVAQLKKRFPAIPEDGVLAFLGSLLAKGLIATAKKTVDHDGFIDFFAGNAPSPTAKALASADAEAGNGITELQKHGYFVRIARKAEKIRKPGENEHPVVLIIEDEPLMAKFLKSFLALEGFEARLAANRNEIVAELRTQPSPSLILLDVMLPDADGFDVLVKVRQHPQLKAIPIIMLTAKATRESVMRGLAGGADGYVTKPFEAENVVKAVRTVLGIEH